MSASQTNIDTQKKRHFGPLIGISAVLIFAAAMLVVYLGNQVEPGENGLFGTAAENIGAAEVE